MYSLDGEPGPLLSGQHLELKWLTSIGMVAMAPCLWHCDSIVCSGGRRGFNSTMLDGRRLAGRAVHALLSPALGGAVLYPGKMAAPGEFWKNLWNLYDDPKKGPVSPERHGGSHQDSQALSAEQPWCPESGGEVTAMPLELMGAAQTETSVD
jgi:hypothetical protein